MRLFSLSYLVAQFEIWLLQWLHWLVSSIVNVRQCPLFHVHETAWNNSSWQGAFPHLNKATLHLQNTYHVKIDVTF
jgi:hypothetical protein